MRARQSLLHFVDENVLDGDRAAILTTGGGYGILQQLTGDKVVMKAAINRLNARIGSGPDDVQNPRITEYHAQLIQAGDRDVLDATIKETIKAEHLDGLPHPEQIAYSIVQGRVSRITAQCRAYGLASLDTIQNAIKAMKNIKGRKMAVFVSDGFPILASDLMTKIMDISDAATRAGVVIYSLDSRGLYTVIPGGDASQAPNIYDPSTVQVLQSVEKGGYEAAKDVMNALARDTGGFPIFNSNDLQAGFKKSLDDNNAYYILAYYPTNTRADGKFREIKIVVKSHPELSIRTRKGYYAPGRRELVADSKLNQKTQNTNTATSAASESNDDKADRAVRDSLGSPVPSTDLGLKMSLNYINLPNKGGLTVLDLLVEPQNLQFGKTDVAELDKEFAKKKANDPGSIDQLANPTTQKSQVPAKDERYASTLDVYVLAFGADGKVATNFKKSIQMKLYQNTYEFVNNNGLFYHDMLALQPGLYQIRLAARQRETGMIGTASEWIEVPDLSTKKLTLSSVFIRPLPPADPDEEDANKKQASSQQYVFSDFTNQAYRAIPSDSQIDMYTVIYNAQAVNGKPDLVIQAQILRDNIVVYGTPLRPVSDFGNDVSRIPYGLRISLKDMKPGKYQLQFSVIDRIAKTNTVRQVGIEIEE
jgi:VWFA-related protein